MPPVKQEGTAVRRGSPAAAFLLGTAGVAGAVALAGCSSSASGRQRRPTLAPFCRHRHGRAADPAQRARSSACRRGIADNEGLPMTKAPPDGVGHVRDAQTGPWAVPSRCSGAATARRSPYYPVRTAFAAPGSYTVAVDYKGHSLSSGIVVAAPKLTLVAAGRAGHPAWSPRRPPTIVAWSRSAPATRCARSTTSTLGDALGNGQPTAFLISSPAYCQTNVCGPVLDLAHRRGLEPPPQRGARRGLRRHRGHRRRSHAPLARPRWPTCPSSRSLVLADAEGMVVEPARLRVRPRRARQALGKVT